WDTIAVVRPGSALVRLQLSNAKSREVPVATWRMGDGSSGETVKDGRLTRNVVHDEVALGASVNRNDDLMWAEVTIANRSKHKVDIEPQTFTLTELSPKQIPLRYLVASLELNAHSEGQRWTGKIENSGKPQRRNFSFGRVPFDAGKLAEHPGVFDERIQLLLEREPEADHSAEL